MDAYRGVIIGWPGKDHTTAAILAQKFSKT